MSTTYQYEKTESPSLSCVHNAVAASEMSDKSLEYCTWEDSTDTLSAIFTNELSPEDEALLDALIDSNPCEPTEPSLPDVVGEVPTGTIDGQNTTFTLANMPTTGTTKVYYRGVRQKLDTDYTESSNTIVFDEAPTTGAALIVDYRK